jgi:CheY-like chemotaxis protein
MAVLIVEPVVEFRQLASEIIRWADRRHRVEYADDGSTGWKMALSRKPELILVSPDLPDIAADTMCVKLRGQLPATTFVAYSNNVDNVLENGAFDGVLQKPPERLAVLTFLSDAKKKRKHVSAFGSPDALNAHQRSRAPKAPDTPFEPVSIHIGLADESALRFSINIPAGAPVGTVLRQIGKSEVSLFVVMRKGMEIDAALTTPMQQDDLLLIKS